MTEDQKRGLGTRLRVERKRLNFAQSDVAGFLGVTRQSVSAWETGGTCPSAIQLAELSVLFCCCAHTLLFGEKHQAELLRKLMPNESIFSTTQEMQK